MAVRVIAVVRMRMTVTVGVFMTVRTVVAVIVAVIVRMRLRSGMFVRMLMSQMDFEVGAAQPQPLRFFGGQPVFTLQRQFVQFVLQIREVAAQIEQHGDVHVASRARKRIDMQIASHAETPTRAQSRILRGLAEVCLTGPEWN